MLTSTLSSFPATGPSLSRSSRHEIQAYGIYSKEAVFATLAAILVVGEGCCLEGPPIIQSISERGLVDQVFNASAIACSAKRLFPEMRFAGSGDV
jgi:hypothetical protein